MPEQNAHVIDITSLEDLIIEVVGGAPNIACI